MFDQILDSVTTDLQAKLDGWLHTVLLDSGPKDKCIRQVFQDVEEQFDSGFLNEDVGEPTDIRKARLELGQEFEQAKNVALPTLTGLMGKVQELQEAQRARK